MNWTKEQENAIFARGGTVLVSAAAGSGKTAVLVERVIQMVCKSKNPCSLDKLLIVTFTKAAAAEMRERIGKALEERLKDNPNDTYLLKQQLILPSAQICTIDSFCSTIVKNYYHELMISPDFRLLEDSEQKALEDEVVSDCVSHLYENPSESFLNLSDLFLLGGSDANLKEAILSIYHYAQAYPVPEQWLVEIPALYSPSTKPFLTPWGQKIVSYIEEIANDNIQIIHSALDLMQDDMPLLATYEPVFLDDLRANETLLKKCQEKNWDSIKFQLDSYVPARMKAAPKEYRDNLIKNTAKSLRDAEKDALKGLIQFIPVTEQEYADDAKILQPIIALLTDTVLDFSRKLIQKKHEMNAYDFNDIAHMALKLCVTLDENNQPIRTKLAGEISKQYDEILLDEYQDTNEAQDMLFSAISKNEKNLFMVGDVKQSIYGFRRAMPKIFLKRRKNASDFSNGVFPAKIDLNANFRSRKTVAEGINCIFSKIMTEKIGGIDYGVSEQLNPSGDFGQTPDLDIELHLIENNDLTEDGELPEANHIAQMIAKLCNDKTLITLKDKTQRPIQYSDICILMRSTTGGEKYKEALEREGIPAFYQKKGGFFSMREISLIVSLLQILDNPFSDIPMCACLMSPIWGFTPDDLATLKMELPHESFFARMQKSSSSKCSNFLKDYSFLRELSTTLPVSSLIRSIYTTTGYMAICGALPGGENRRLNLLLLLQYAYDYENSGKTGLSGFIRYLNRLEENESSVEAATGVSSYANVVRIMTIHKSKGLEFPVVILAKCGSSFNTQDQKKKMILHNDMKIGIRVPDRENHRVFDSLPYLATKLAVSEDEKAEELRVLYVALTRAREKLILVGSGSKKRGLPNIVHHAALSVLNSSNVPPYFIRHSNSYLDLLVAALLKQKNAKMLFDLADIPPMANDPVSFPLVVSIQKDVLKEKTEIHSGSLQNKKVDKELLATIKNRVNYQYARKALSYCPAKVSASALNDKVKSFDFFATARPAFLGKAKLTPAMRGTLMHRFVEKCNFKNASVNLDEEIKRLIERDFFTLEEASSLDKNALQMFFESNLFKRMIHSERIYREQKFTVFFPAKEVNSDIPSNLANEQVLVQGVLDCAFEENGKIVIVDYKTDHEKDEEHLKEQYRKQLYIYKCAAKEIFNLDVSETLLYSFYLRKEILINL